MKAIKIIFGLVSVLVILFFSTGLLVKETTYQVRVEIEKPISEVFTVFSDEKAMKNWLPEIQSIASIVVKPGMVGSEYEIVVRTNEQDATITKKVLAYIPNQKITFYFDSKNVLKTDDYTFNEKNGITSMVKDVSCKSESYIINCMFPYVKGFFRDMDQEQMNNFKAYIEN